MWSTKPRPMAETNSGTSRVPTRKPPTSPVSRRATRHSGRPWINGSSGKDQIDFRSIKPWVTADFRTAGPSDQTKGEQVRLTAWRLRVLRQAADEGNVARVCRRFGL